MRSNLAPETPSGQQTRCETPKARMAKASLPSLTLREHRAEYGAILRRASEIAGMNRDQTADALGVDTPSQITRWWTGEENGQTWRYNAHPALRAALRLAEAEDAERRGEVQIEHVIRVLRKAV